MVIAGGTSWLAEVKGPRLTSSGELEPIAGCLEVIASVTVVLHSRSDCQKTKDDQEACHFQAIDHQACRKEVSNLLVLVCFPVRKRLT